MRKLVKKLYSTLPLKKQIFTLIKYFYTPRETVYRHLYFKAPFTVNVHNNYHFRLMHNGSQFENNIFWKGIAGAWETYSIYTWTELSKLSNTIVDIGANTGFYTLTAKCLNNDSKVFAFEPIKRMFDILNVNVRLNNYHDIVLINKAVSNKNGFSHIFDQPFEIFRQASLNPQFQTSNSIPIKIETVTVDTFFQQYENSIDLIKVDVESYEPQVLSGALNTVRKYRPTMLIEILNDELGKEIENILDDFDYSYFNIDEKKGLSSTDTLTKNANRNYLLVSRKEHEDVIMKL